MKRLWILGLLGGLLGWAICSTIFAQSPGGAQTKTFTLEDLAQYTGKDGKPAYIAVDGIVYDVTKVPEWAGGHHNGFDAGRDLTKEIKTVSPHGVSKLQGVPVVGKLAGTETPGIAGTNVQKSQEIGIFQVLRRPLARFLGLTNIVLAGIAGSLFLFRRINKYVWANKNERIKKLLKPLSKIHPYIGMTLVVTAFIHGTLALGTLFRVHTGPLAWLILVLMMVVALLGKKHKIKNWVQVHRSLAILLVIAILIHLFARNIF
jgi:predicted heme/steroid binding protein